jgi:hypothetical protein
MDDNTDFWRNAFLLELSFEQPNWKLCWLALKHLDGLASTW